MAKVRVHDLAKEFGVESRVVLAWLRQLGYFVKSAASTVEAPVVKVLSGAYERGELGTPRVVRRRPGANPFIPPRTVVDKNLADAAAMFGVPVEDLKPAQSSRPRTGGRYASANSRRPLDDWTRLLFSAEDKRVWMLAGLGGHDARLAQQCVSAGITPEDLQLRVDGVRAGARLRGGESVASVRLRIEEQKRRTATDTA